VPTYQYACTACGHELEAVQSFTDDPLTRCPSCEGRLRKVFSSVGVVFKGSGFYRTDSRSAPAESTAGKATESANGGAKTDAGPSAGGPSGPDSGTPTKGDPPASKKAPAATPA
jgi:putative FmdB family regulatory protein